MEKAKRLKRLGKMLQEFKLIKQEKRQPCAKCGNKMYYIFEDPRVKANGVYCSLCGEWLKFEHSKKYAKIRKRIKARKTSKQREEDRFKYSRYLKSAKWQQIRYMIAKRDSFTCCSCGKDVSKYFEIHHRNYKHIFHEEEDLDSLVCLCKQCHERITAKQKKGIKRKQ